jgi:hypothetical protein
MKKSIKKYSFFYFHEDEYRRMGTTEAYVLAINKDEVLMAFEITKKQLLNLFTECNKEKISLKTIQSILNTLKFEQESGECGWTLESSQIQSVIYSTLPKNQIYNEGEILIYTEEFFKPKDFVEAGMGHCGICLGQFNIFL